ncbi:TIGR02757 family protein [candidate division KSB1 bacterium]
MTYLKHILDSLYVTYDKNYLRTDPLQFAHCFSLPRDQEVTALVSAALAYGNVKQIFASIRKILSIVGDSPHRFVKHFDPDRHTRLFDTFRHRFTGGRDVALLLYYLRQVYETYPSLEAFFLEHYSPSDESIEKGLTKFIEGMLALDCSPFYTGGLPRSSGVRYLLSSPLNGSACKRMNLFLRWMVRTEGGYDLGLWKHVSPSLLVLPLDTHTSRISRYIGLSSRRAPSWLMALEVTRRLRLYDPDDPVKYDFALSRLGILDLCQHEYRMNICSDCRLQDVCVHTGNSRSVSFHNRALAQ